MKTIFLLMSQYNAAMISIDTIREDYFGGMNARTFAQHIESGAIPLPVSLMGQGRKATKMVALSDFAAYLDAESERARIELKRKVG